jgi:hypothetical protein
MRYCYVNQYIRGLWHSVRLLSVSTPGRLVQFAAACYIGTDLTATGAARSKKKGIPTKGDAQHTGQTSDQFNVQVRPIWKMLSPNLVTELLYSSATRLWLLAVTDLLRAIS